MSLLSPCAVPKRRLTSQTVRNCDAIVSTVDGVLFFYSCVSVIENRKRKSRSESEDENESDEKQTYPCINYWIVTKMLVKEREQVLFAKLMKSGLDISDVKPIRARKKVNRENIFLPFGCK